MDKDTRVYPTRQEEAEFYDRINRRAPKARQEPQNRPSMRRMPLGATPAVGRPLAPNQPLVSTADASIRASLARLAQKIEDSGIIERQPYDSMWNDGELLLGLRNAEWLAIHRLNALLRELSK